MILYGTGVSSFINVGRELEVGCNNFDVFSVLHQFQLGPNCGGTS